MRGKFQPRHRKAEPADVTDFAVRGRFAVSHLQTAPVEAHLGIFFGSADAEYVMIPFPNVHPVTALRLKIIHHNCVLDDLPMAGLLLFVKKVVTPGAFR